ncbi:neutral zinc metallopeptidase [Lentzea sp. NPDC006480]|uniref:neutral zinc metallopeptidase n=1 Tax=Lentzea sp. NPDC006480 TaxID=3157176 RepID=UPI00339FA7E9
MPPPRPTWGHQPQPGFAPYPMMPPRRKSSSGPVLALVLGGVVILGLGAVGVFAASFNHKVKDTGYSNYTTYSPTFNYTTTTEATTTTTTTASTRTSSTRTSSSTPTTPPGPKAVYKLADHPIFSTGVGANDFAACPLPPMRYDPAGEETFLSAALPCIEKAWQPAMKAANLPYQPVELHLVTETMQYPCGTVRTDATARYCQGGIYWPAGFYANEQGGTRHPGVYLGQLSHEYGHHVQWLAGFLKAASQAQYDAGGFDTAKGLELNRRKELQATCFGGMTLAPFSHKGVIPMDVVNTGLQDAGTRGDYDRTPADHGSAPNNDRWVMHGHKQNDIKACNTWAASSADVA